MNIYLIVIIVILVFNYLLNLFIDVLNVRSAKASLPDEFKDYYDAQKYTKAQNYLKDKTNFKLANNSFFILVLISLILSGGFNLIDQFSRSFGFGQILTGLIFVGLLFLAFQIIEIPFSIYNTFIIEQKYGFNRTKPATFALDLLKGWGLTMFIGGLLFAVINWFFIKTGSWAWVLCWLATTLFQIFMIFIAPVLILPLFNKFIPLEEGELKTAIDDYARSQDFRLKGVFTMDGSRRSSKSNAYFTGFGRYRRIVLFDTLIKNHTVDELVSVLAHEMGHYKKKHILKYIALSIATNGLMFYILSLFINNPGLFSAFKMQELSIYASLLFFSFLYTPIEMILSVFSNYLSRRHEYEADRFSVLTYRDPEAFTRALKKLTVDNLSNLTPHPLKVFFSYSHPPVLLRIKAIQNALN